MRIRGGLDEFKETLESLLIFLGILILWIFFSLGDELYLWVLLDLSLLLPGIVIYFLDEALVVLFFGMIDSINC